MNSTSEVTRDVYYTHDHEWVSFQGSVAYMGISAFKLTGFREIHQIQFNHSSGFKHKGELLATVHYRDYRIEINMPVDGKVVDINDSLVSGDREILLHEPEANGWVARIIPAKPDERANLLRPEQYPFSDKSKQVNL